MDLAKWWRDRRWKALLELIDGLPSTSRYRAAVLSDPELAAQALAEDTGEDEKPWSPPLTEFDTHAAIAAETRDLLGDVLRALIAIKAGVPTVQVERLRTPPKANIKPFPRPVTAMEEARERAARQAAQQVMAWFFPHATSQN